MTDHRAPALPLFLAEALSLPAIVRRSGRARGMSAPAGDGRAVMVLPGLMAGDFATRSLRATIAQAGYRPHGWGQGLNRGASLALLDRLRGRLDRIAGDGQVSLVGWSLGGLFARELAKHRPDVVDRVVTLGSPFSGDLRANHAWRLYRLASGHSVDHVPIPIDLAAKPPVPTWALWSTRDGIVCPDTTRGRPGERDVAVEVGCRHLGFTTDRRSLAAILEALAAPLPGVAADRGLGKGDRSAAGVRD